MFALFFTISWKILEYSLVTAIMLTLIEIAPGGESLNVIIMSIKDVLLGIEWSTLIEKIGVQLQLIFNNIWENLNNK